jgi:hypothetical protein
VGQEGTGKSTIVRALLHRTPRAAQIDAEDVGQVNPFEMNEAFIELLWKNVLALIVNFWEAGYSNVIAGSFLSTYEEYRRFRQQLPKDVDIYLVHLCTSKPVRDQRRIERAKPTSKYWRDRIDLLYPEDTTLQNAQDDYRYIRVDNDHLSIDDTVAVIKGAIPEIYGPKASLAAPE